ncbi:MAG: RsmD family RNA methyltransferase [Thermodesulfovibrionales bacterium]|nr:RsmD family RNA methyltransferase [Thermodesulfovibrionales bacterium]
MDKGKKSIKIDIRRTTSLVKKAFFDIIGERIKNSHFLDLYAGEGGVGLEALKRGADSVLFVEISKKNPGIIKRRLLESGLSEKGRVIIMHVASFLKTSKEDFDIVFADPPYESGEYDILIKNLPLFSGIKKDTILCIEHFHKKILPEDIGSLVLLRRYRYGDTVLSFYRRQE